MPQRRSGGAESGASFAARARRRQKLLQRRLRCPAGRRRSPLATSSNGRGIGSPPTSAAARSNSACTVATLGVTSRPAPRRRMAAVARLRRTGNLRRAARLDDQCPRRHQAGQLGVAKLIEQAKHVAIDRLLPHVLPRVEVAAHQRRVDPRVERRGIQRQQAAFAVADHADRPLRCVPASRDEPIDGRQHLLHFVADDVPAHLERRAIEELAMRLIRSPASPMAE